MPDSRIIVGLVRLLSRAVPIVRCDGCERLWLLPLRFWFDNLWWGDPGLLCGRDCEEEDAYIRAEKYAFERGEEAARLRTQDAHDDACQAALDEEYN